MDGVIDIMGMKYKIKEVPVIDRDQYKFGEIRFVEQEILIDQALSEEKKTSTLLHEILHGICVETGLNDLSEDEHTIQLLANSLYCVLGKTISLSSLVQPVTEQSLL